MFWDSSRLRRSFVSAVLASSLLLVGGAHYVVAPADTLSSIAARNGVTVATLAAENGITDIDRIRAGDRLVLPAPVAVGSSPAGSHATHTVKRGESVASIAADHGITVGQLETANGIVNGVIYAGTALRLSGSGFVARSGGSSTHVVAADDTLSHLAAHHGTTAHDLAHANGLSEDHLVSAGTVLEVPVSWQCPVSGAVYFNDWGFPRSGGRTHVGTDLFAPRGTPVLAPVSGVVEQVTGSIGGHQFTLRGDDENTYLGSHMDSFGAGGRVAAGTVIGYVGDSGNAEGTDPHLHFQVHPGDGYAAILTLPLSSTTADRLTGPGRQSPAPVALLLR